MKQKKSKKSELNRKSMKNILKILDGLKNRPIQLEALGFTKLFQEEESDGSYFFSEDGLLLFFHGKDGRMIPSLKLLRNHSETLEKYPRVTLDSGATKFILNGADVFRPGIQDFSDFNRDDVVVVLNDKLSPISVGISIYSSNDLPEKGAVIENRHFLGDKIWKKTW
ncbi:MAG: PUA domain-containing protein [Candidatus Hodarchaeales archaeon]